MSAALDGTNGLTFNDGTQMGTANSLGMRNRIINGDMRIDQRNAGAAVTSINSGFFVDRFKGQNSSSTGTAQRIASTLGGTRYSLLYTANSSNTFLQSGQQIEFDNCSDLQNKTVTISFKAKANNANAGSTAFLVRTRTVAGVDGTAIFAGTNVDTAITLTTTAATYSVTRTLPATFGALSVEFLLGSHVSGDGFEITGVQLEEGSVATPFERRPIGVELALCQRYFQTYGGNSGNERLGGGFNYLTTQSRIDMFLATTMRSAPTLTISSASHFSVEYGGGAIVCTAISLDQPGTKVVSLNCNVSSGLVQGQGVHLNASGTLDARLNLSAEL